VNLSRTNFSYLTIYLAAVCFRLINQLPPCGISFETNRAVEAAPLAAFVLTQRDEGVASTSRLEARTKFLPKSSKSALSS
jgi:hypothetical protein